MFLGREAPGPGVPHLEALLKVVFGSLLNDCATLRLEMGEFEKVRLVCQILLLDHTNCCQPGTNEYVLLVLLFRLIEQPVLPHLELPDHRVGNAVLVLSIHIHLGLIITPINHSSRTMTIVLSSGRRRGNSCQNKSRLNGPVEKK